MGPKSQQSHSSDKTKESKVSNEKENSQLSEKEIDKCNTSNFELLKIFVLIVFSISILGLIHFYLLKLAESIKEENISYQEKLKRYKTKYDELVNFNLLQNSNQEANQVKDYTKENDEAISNIKNKLKELRQQVNTLESTHESVVNEIISGHIENLKKEIQIRQEEANKNYLTQLKALKKQEKAKLENVEFKYYYNYNQTERDLFTHYLRPYDGNSPSLWSIFYEIQKNTTTVYKDFDKTEQQNKLLNGAEVALKNAIKDWESYSSQKLAENEKLKTEINSKSLEKKSKAIDVLKGLREIRSKSKSHLLEILSNSFDFKDYYNHLYKAFGERNFNFRLLFNSNKYEEFSDLKNDLVSLAGQEHLLFYAQTVDDRLVGGYLNLEFPKFVEQSANEIYLDDPNSFIFEFKAKEKYAQVFHAIKFARIHFSCKYVTNSTMYFGFGNIKNDEGLTFNFKEPDRHDPQVAYASYGKRPVAFEIGDIKTEFNKDQFASPAHKVKTSKVYKIDFLE